MDMLAKEWDVTDEGPMDDLLGIEIDYLPDGGIKLHQTAYVNKVVNRFMPDARRPAEQVPARLAALLAGVPRTRQRRSFSRVG